MSKRPPLFLVLAACAGASACAGGGDPSQPPDDLLPDGATGVERVTAGHQTVDLPWIARGGMKWIEDDWAIGPATRAEFQAATSLAVGKWPDNHVPFCVQRFNATTNPLGLTDAQRQIVTDALGDLEDITPLRFDIFECNASSPPASYVDYRMWTNTESSVTTAGMGHAGNTIQFAPSFGARTVWHETGHALGYMHEQRRPDRDDFVNYYPSCLSDPSHDSQFAQVASTTLTLTPYDIDSVMQYGSGSFSKDKPTSTHKGCPTLLDGAPDPATAPIYATVGSVTLRGTLIDKSSGWSAEDINAAYQLYEPRLGSAEQNDRLGTSVVSGDFDGDGYDDLAVGAMGEQPGSSHGGAVFVYKGTMNGLVAWKLLQEADFASVNTQSTDDFGMRMAAGDLDGDGIDDLAIGAPLYGANHGGAVFVYLGQRGGPRAAFGPLTQGGSGAGAGESGDMFGAALAIGKFTGGSARYLAVGAPYEGISGVTGSRGMVSIYQWGVVSLGFVTNLHPSQVGVSIAGGQFGAALAAGDVNLDGIDDLVVGAPASSVGTGTVSTFLGSAGGLVPGQVLSNSDTLAVNDQFGTSLAIGHNGATLVLLVGAPGHAGPGRAYGYTPFGLGSPPVNVQLIQFSTLQQNQIPGEAGHSGDGFGTTIGLADVDGDGSVDYLVGAPGKPISGIVAGEIAIFGTSAGNSVLAPTTPHAGDMFGSAFAAGNFNRGAKSAVSNRRIDLAVGLPGRPVGSVSAAGVFNTYKGTSLALWRQMTEETHDGP